MRRLIIYLVRKRLGLKKFQNFRFANQKDNSVYYFTNYGLRKVETVGEGENSYTRSMRSRVSLNWILDDDCKVEIVETNRE